jgi:hypothetical protein
MKKQQHTLAKNVAKRSKISALWTRITKQCIRWWNRHDLDVMILLILCGGGILFVMAIRAIS